MIGNHYDHNPKMGVGVTPFVLKIHGAKKRTVGGLFCLYRILELFIFNTIKFFSIF